MLSLTVYIFLPYKTLESETAQRYASADTSYRPVSVSVTSR